MLSSFQFGNLWQNAMNSYNYDPALLPLRKFVTNEKGWILDGKETKETWDLERQAEFETIFTIGNGYGGQRAVYEECTVPLFDRGQIFGQYLAGIYDQFDSSVEEIVVTPAWIPFRVFIDGYHLNVYPLSKRSNAGNCPFEVLDHERVLDMKKGTLYRHTVYKDWMQRITHYESLRFMSFDNQHNFIQRVALTPENYEGAAIQIHAEIDGATRNHGPKAWEPGVDPYVQHEYGWEKHGRHHHYEINKTKFVNLPGMKERASYIEGETLGYRKKRNAKKLLGYASNLRFVGNEDLPQLEYCMPRKTTQIIQIPKDRVKQRKSLIFDKYVSVYTSRDYFGTTMKTNWDYNREHFENDPNLDREISNWVENSSINNLRNAVPVSFEEQLNRHARVMQEDKWKYADFEFLGNEKLTHATRFNLYHLIIAGNPHDQMSPIGARTLSGDAYNGHSFWDTEIFTLPYFIYTQPEVAKSLLLFRYKTLPQARLNAKKEGYRGAKFPWESGESGTEQTPVWVGNPMDPERIWTGDEELHISSDVVYGIINYFNAHKDEEFITSFGLEMMIEVARFWTSRMKWNKDKNQFDIEKVIGPDESHEHVTNSAFTNYMAKWCIEQTMKYYNLFKNSPNEKLRRNVEETTKRCDFKPEEEFKEMQERISKLYLSFDPKTKLIEEFDGYYNLKEIPIVKFDKSGLPDIPDGISEIWPFVKRDPSLTHISFTKLVKQADVVMLCYLLSGEKGYPFDYETNRKNFEYYEQRTLHKSSLSPAVFSFMGVACDYHKYVVPYFKKSLMVDLDNNRGNTHVGFHAASAGGTWCDCVHGFGGFRPQGDKITFHPFIPSQQHVEGMPLVSKDDLFEGVKYKLAWRNNLLEITIKKNKAWIKLLPLKQGGANEEKIEFMGKEYTLRMHETKEIDWEEKKNC